MGCGVWGGSGGKCGLTGVGGWGAVERCAMPGGGSRFRAGDQLSAQDWGPARGWMRVGGAAARGLLLALPAEALAGILLPITHPPTHSGIRWEWIVPKCPGIQTHHGPHLQGPELADRGLLASTLLTGEPPRGCGRGDGPVVGRRPLGVSMKGRLFSLVGPRGRNPGSFPSDARR